MTTFRMAEKKPPSTVGSKTPSTPLRTDSPAVCILPPCPITGRPARRRVQKISLNLLRSLWRLGLGIDVDRLFHGVTHPGLYESECGLVFFHPMIPGDRRFYSEFYSRVRMHDYLGTDVMSRMEYRHAARYVGHNAVVLDVGCGRGDFRHHLPNAHYRGLDPFGPAHTDGVLVREALISHVERCPESYDVVTAFQVIEHVAEPRGFAESMLRAVRPGGYLVLCAPLHPSPMTAIPNFLLNTLPHHLSWWNQAAFAALAEALRLETVEITPLPPSPQEGLIHWMHRLSPCKAENGSAERYFGHRWSWHLSLALSFGIAKAAFALQRLPRGAGSINIFFAARKPG